MCRRDDTGSAAGGTTRMMDCIEFQNAAAHRIAPTAEQAVNRAMAAGRSARPCLSSAAKRFDC